MVKPGVMFYFDVRPSIKRLNLKEKGALFEAILDYGEFGTIPNLDGKLGIAWDFIQPKLDKDDTVYEEKRARNQIKGWKSDFKRNYAPAHGIDPDDKEALEAYIQQRLTAVDSSQPTTTNNLQPQLTTTTTTTDTDNIYADKPPRTRFIPPTVDEVKAYCIERGNTVDAERFIDYYTANGWQIGKNKMKDWKAAVRTWERNGFADTKPKGGGMSANIREEDYKTDVSYYIEN